MAIKRKSESAKKDPAKKRAAAESTAAADEKPISPAEEEATARFLGEPVADEEARKRWPHRYQKNQSTVHCFCVLLIELGYVYRFMTVHICSYHILRIYGFCLFMV